MYYHINDDPHLIFLVINIHKKILLLVLFLYCKIGIIKLKGTPL